MDPIGIFMRVSTLRARDMALEEWAIKHKQLSFGATNRVNGMENTCTLVRSTRTAEDLSTMSMAMLHQAHLRTWPAAFPEHISGIMRQFF